MKIQFNFVSSPNFLIIFFSFHSQFKKDFSGLKRVLQFCDSNRCFPKVKQRVKQKQRQQQQLLQDGGDRKARLQRDGRRRAVVPETPNPESSQQRRRHELVSSRTRRTRRYSQKVGDEQHSSRDSFKF